jgi:hypothetical protein
MSYTLERLAPGSYDVVLDGRVVASLVRSGQTSDATWTAELLEDMPQGQRPAPFTEQEHAFSSLEEARAWLGAQMPSLGLALPAEPLDAHFCGAVEHNRSQAYARLRRRSQGSTRVVQVHFLPDGGAVSLPIEAHLER